MRDFVELGSSPAEEECVQVRSGEDYLPAMRAECKRYLELIRKVCGEEPEGARLAIKSNSHDFGTYLDVVCYYDDGDEEAAEYAWGLEDKVPAKWLPSA
jgi:hypothetical protein